MFIGLANRFRHLIYGHVHGFLVAPQKESGQVFRSRL
jgi:hypothetical protein